MLFGTCLLAGTGCDDRLAAELATLSGNYIGDVTSTVVVHWWEDALGIETADNEASDEHEHESAALHDHEH
jgi:hypothetical protein